MAWLSNQAVDWRLSARALFRLEAALLGVACFSASAVPRLLPILLGLLGLVAAIHVFTTDRSPLFKLLRRPFSIGLFVFLGYVFINTMWSPDRVAALLKAATVLGLAAATLLIAASYALRSDREARVLAKSALAGLLLGIAFLLIELSFGEPIARFLNNHVIQLFNVSPKKTKIVEGEVTKIAAFVLNRNVTSLVLLLIPGILFTAAVATTTARRVSLGVLVGATAVAVLLSESGTSVVAFFAGGLVLALSALSLKVTRTVLIVGWTIATLLAVPLGALPYELGWHHWTWLPPESVAARFYIWKYVADPCQRDQSRGSASAARAHCIWSFRPTRAIRATPNMHCGDAWRAIRTTSISKPGSSSAPSAPCCCLSSGSPRSGRCASCRPRSREAPMRCSRSQA
jgi:hypothetical protein